MKSITLMLMLSVSVLACPKGTIDHEGVCAADLQPASAPADEVKPSDEKPSRNPVPAYLRGEVKADMGKRAVDLPTASDDQSGKLPNGGVPDRNDR